jgi:hypothetical protein
MTTKDFFTTILVPAVTAVTGILAFSLSNSVSKFEAKLKERDATRQDAAEVRLVSEQQAQMHLQVYDAVMKSLDTDDPRKQKVATSLVVAMLNPDDSMRLGLLEVLTKQASGEVKAQASTALEESRQYVTQQQSLSHLTTPPSVDDWTSYNLDVFWCAANGPTARDGANRVLNALQQAGSKGRLRIREFGDSINASPGYRISGLAIRREASEESVAQAVKKIADSGYGSGGDGFQLTSSTQGTPGYVGLFVCQ